MGYRSDVRSLIYGDPGKIDALIAKHALLGTKGHGIMDDVRIYEILRPIGEPLPQAEQVPGPVRYAEVTYRCIDLEGNGWKWYSVYPDVAFWTELLAEAAEMELNTEFMRIGEEPDDIEVEINIVDDGESYLSVDRTINCDAEPADKSDASVCEGA